MISYYKSLSQKIIIILFITFIITLSSGILQCRCETVPLDLPENAEEMPTLISLAGNFVNYFIKKTPEIFKLTIEHLWMTVLAVLLAIFIGVPVAILLTRHRKVASFIIGIASFIQTIPSLALLGFMIPVMGIGWGPAVVALFLYALLPIIRNTYTGIENVDPAITEAGRGMGLTSIQILYMLELPLAVPVIMAGIRTSTVINVGVATLCALVGAGGLGQLIFRGISMINSNMILAGAIPAALLALLLDYILGLCEESLSCEGIGEKPKTSKKVMGIATIVFIALLGVGFYVASTSNLSSVPVEKTDKVVIGSKNFTEQHILNHMLALLIEDRTGLKVESKDGSTFTLQNSLVAGDIDLYVEYTGTALTVVLEEDGMQEPDEIYNKVKNFYKEKFKVLWLEPFGFNNNYTMIVKKDFGEKHDLKTISDLKKLENEIMMGVDEEFLVRPDCYSNLKKIYDFDPGRNINEMEPDLMYGALKEGEVDLICGYSTDGRIPEFDLLCLEDDKNSFPPYYAVPVVSQKALDKHPELERVINILAGKISNEDMMRLNNEVDIKKRSSREVAEEFLLEKGLLTQ